MNLKVIQTICAELHILAHKIEDAIATEDDSEICSTGAWLEELHLLYRSETGESQRRMAQEAREEHAAMIGADVAKMEEEAPLRQGVLIPFRGRV